MTKKEYQKMFETLADIGLTLARDYPEEKKLFEAFDTVANFIGDVAEGRQNGRIRKKS